MTAMPTLRRRLLTAAALAAITPLALSACGGGDSDSSGSETTETVDSLTVLDYYTDDPGHTQIGDQLTKCGDLDRRRQDRPPVRAGSDADPEGAAAGLLQDAAGRADARQPRPPADRRHRRAGSAGATSTSTPTASPRARSTRRHVRGQALRPGSRWPTRIALFYNKDVLAEGRRRAAEHLGRAEGRGQEAHHRRPVRPRLQRHSRLRGHLAVPAADVDQRRRRDEPRQPRGGRRPCSSGRTWSTTARRPRASSTGRRPTSRTSSWPARPR